MGVIFALFFGAAVVVVIIIALILALIELLGTLVNTVFGFFLQVGMFSLIAIVGIVGTIIVWKLLKRGWKEVQEFRQYLKKNKEIENRMKQQAMRK